MRINLNTQWNIGDRVWCSQTLVDGVQTAVKVQIYSIQVYFDNAYDAKNNTPRFTYGIMPCEPYEARLPWPYMHEDEEWDWPIYMQVGFLFHTEEEARKEIEEGLPF